jgi:hypothetical protein
MIVGEFTVRMKGRFNITGMDTLFDNKSLRDDMLMEVYKSLIDKIGDKEKANEFILRLDKVLKEIQLKLGDDEITDDFLYELDDDICFNNRNRLDQFMEHHLQNIHDAPPLVHEIREAIDVHRGRR